MINQNLDLNQININVFDIRIIGEEIQKLYKKYGGKVNVKISKPEVSGTEQQNRCMHSLLAEYFASGLHSSPAKNINEFKVCCKLLWGPCFEYEYENKKVMIPKSWSDYSKEDRASFIDKLISDINQSGAFQIPKIQEILKTLEENSLLK